MDQRPVECIAHLFRMLNATDSDLTVKLRTLIDVIVGVAESCVGRCNPEYLTTAFKCAYLPVILRFDCMKVSRRRRH